MEKGPIWHALPERGLSALFTCVTLRSKLKLSPITHKRRHRGLIVHHTWEPNSTRPRNLNRALFKIRRKRTWSSLIGPKNRVRIFSLLATWNRWMESVRSFRKLARLECMLFNSISRAFNWENVYERSVQSLRRAGFPGELSPDSSWVNCAIYGLVLATVRCGCWMAASRPSIARVIVIGCRKYLWKTSPGSRVSGSTWRPGPTLWAREYYNRIMSNKPRVLHCVYFDRNGAAAGERHLCEVDFSKLEWTFLWCEIKQDSKKRTERFWDRYQREVMRW